MSNWCPEQDGDPWKWEGGMIRERDEEVGREQRVVLREGAKRRDGAKRRC